MCGHQRIALRATLLLIAAAVGACGIFDPDEQRHIGLIDVAEAAPIVPDSAVAGEAFEVVVTTLMGGCSRGGDTEVRVTLLHATVTPYDLTRIDRNRFCPGVLKHAVHRASITFDQRGIGRISIRARQFASGEALELEYEVAVF